MLFIYYRFRKAGNVFVIWINFISNCDHKSAAQKKREKLQSERLGNANFTTSSPWGPQQLPVALRSCNFAFSVNTKRSNELLGTVKRYLDQIRRTVKKII